MHCQHVPPCQRRLAPDPACVVCIFTGMAAAEASAGRDVKVHRIVTAIAFRPTQPYVVHCCRSRRTCRGRQRRGLSTVSFGMNARRYWPQNCRHGLRCRWCAGRPTYYRFEASRCQPELEAQSQVLPTRTSGNTDRLMLERFAASVLA